MNHLGKKQGLTPNYKRSNSVKEMCLLSYAFKTLCLEKPVRLEDTMSDMSNAKSESYCQRHKGDL